MNENCAKCRYVADRNQRDQFECHRHPPVIIQVAMGGSGFQSGWPSVRPNDFCGEFAPNKNAF